MILHFKYKYSTSFDIEQLECVERGYEEKKMNMSIDTVYKFV